MAVRKAITKTSTTKRRAKPLPKDIKIIIGVMVIIMGLIVGAYLIYTLKPTEIRNEGDDEGNTYITNTEILEGYNETIYPLGADSGVNITGGTNPEEYGNWTEVVPETYTNWTFTITGVYISSMTANLDMYVVQIGIGDENNNQTICIFLIHGSEVGSPKHIINYGSIDKNTRVSARCQSESGGNDSLLIWISGTRIT